MTSRVYIASVDTYSGKSLAALALGLHLREAGHRVGYFKPLGALPVTVRDVTTDEDAYFVSNRLNPDAPLDAI
ncbi:MAG: AAA family ATPase, partial [Proteobacteria bacterium]|nr:AAA family ATPase [Pseudomonadota bacterium]